MTTETRFYAACLASYNNGVLHGRWIDASADVDAMQEEVSAMLRDSKFPNVTVPCYSCDGTGEKTFHNSETGDTRQGACPTCNGKGTVPSAEEWAIHDFEGLPNFGEYCGLQVIADYVELLEEFNHIDAGNMLKIYGEFQNVDDMREALNDDFVGIVDSFRDYSDETADEMLHDVADFARNYFDYDAFARDLQMDMRVVDVDGGQIAIFHA
jgi:antirestriction protein